MPSLRQSLTVLTLILLPLLLPATLMIPSLDFDLEDPPQGIFSEDWMEIHIGGQKSGYSHLTIRREGDVIITRQFMKLSISRAMIPLEILMEEINRETVDGKPLGFLSRVIMAGQPIEKEGAFSDGQLELVHRQGDFEDRQSQPFTDRVLMNWGMILETVRRGMKPGLTYTLPIFNSDLSMRGGIPVKVQYVDWEEYPFLGEKRRDMRVESTISLGNTNIVTVSWVDEEFRVWKTSTEMMGLPFTTYAVSQEEAMKDFVPAELFVRNMFMIEEPIPSDADEVVFRIQSLVPGKKLEAIPELDYQKVKQLDVSTQEVTLLRAPLSTGQKPEAASELPGQEYLASNLFINADDPVIRELAEQALRGFEGGDLEKAIRLRRFVSEYIEEKNMDVGFASASEVARKREGDCTEHAVLLAALGRAAGLPSRVNSGLVYLPSWGGQDNVMGYHMWTQFYIDGRWVDFDAAVEDTDRAPVRIAMMSNSLNDQSLSELGLAMMDLIGQISVQLESVK